MGRMENNSTNSYEIISWKDISQIVAGIDPELAQIIDNCPGSKTHKLVKASYSYGENIIKAGDFHFPNDHGFLVPFKNTSSKIQELFNYFWGSIPFGILLSGSAESYWSGTEQTTSIGMLHPGSTYALRTIFDKQGWCNFKDAFDLSSGARSIFLLPSIKDTTKFKKLGKVLERRITIPKEFNDHWHLLKEICHSKISDNSWKSEFLFFTTAWLEDMFSGKSTELYNYLRNRAWINTEFSRNRKIFDYIWNDYIRIAKRKGIKAKDYLFDFAKHLILIGIGDEYGFGFSFNNKVAPVSIIRRTFIEHYKITQDPTVMSAATIRWGKPSKVFFSLQHCANLLTYPHRSSLSSSLDDVRDVKAIVDLFMESIKKAQLSFGGTRFTELPERIRYEYYHTDKDYAQQAMSSTLIAQDIDIKELSSKLEFCSSSLFFKGCVKITSS